MKKIGVVTGTRAEFGILQPLLRGLQAEPGFALRLYVTGAHLSPAQGETVREIEKTGLPIAARVPILDEALAPRDIATAMGRSLTGFTAVYEAEPPDLLIVLGDRYEIFAAAAAAVPFNLKLLHLQGGELTLGSNDDRFRHALTKLSHYHAVATEDSRRRVMQLGERPENVRVTGALGLDALRHLKPLTREQMQQEFQLDLSSPPLLVSFHPSSTSPESSRAELETVLEALCQLDGLVVLTGANADPHGDDYNRRLREFARQRPQTSFVASLGSQAYWSLMMHSAALVGNSSSGIIEAASVPLPAVNIGTRQSGRFRPRNVVDAEASRDAIVAAIRKATVPAFREELRGLQNPYGDGHATEHILTFIHDILARQDGPEKNFYDLPGVGVK
jgi:UDP-hydrolysing UDP-N-acetyl-D-glucosamine 2-epimerase